MTDEVEWLTKLGQFGPGFAVAAFVYLHGRRDRDKVDLERQAERDRERAREKEHMTLVVDMNAKLLDTMNANTRAITSFDATQSALLRRLERDDPHAAPARP